MKRRVCNFRIIIFIIFSTIVSGSVHNNIKYDFHKSSVSRSNLIKSSLFSWRGEEVLFSDQSHSVLTTETVNILAFMVEFVQSDDSLATGDGTFVITSEDTVIDPPPHNRSYFEDQLTALSSYYNSVSGGKLILNGTVFPEILKLDHTISYYSSEESDTGVDRGLAELFQDAIYAADEAGAEFSHYDSYIIFHAGVGNDFAFDYDPTPHDIHSAFIDLDKLQRYLGEGDPSFQGIEVENSNYPIQEGIILPETQNQEDAQYFYEIGLLGTMCIMYGFQLGLPALWNTETGLSGIGRWGLMDQGSGNYMGLIPAEPCAFSKVLLGWEKPVVITQQNDLKIGCSRSAESNKIYKIPINDHEYFLIENRQYDTNGDSITYGKTGSDAEVIFKPDEETGGMTVVMTEPGVITWVEEYDYGLPGSGILIWHIDEQVIRRNIEGNRINANEDHRGVDLEEADGAQDIGELYSYTSAGYGSEYGVLHDAWFQDNERNQEVNDTSKVMFTPYSFPNSRSNQDGNSHIVITDFSKSKTVMSFSVTTDMLQSGFPSYFQSCSTWVCPVLSGDLNADGNQELIVASENAVYAWKNDGTPFYTDSTGFRVTAANDTVYYEVPLVLRSAEKISIPPLAVDINGDNQDEIIIADNSGTVSGWSVEFDNEGSLISTNIFSWEDDQNLVSTYLHVIISPADTCLVYGTRNGTIISLTSTGSLNWSYETDEDAITGICQAAEDGTIAVTTSDMLLFIDTHGSLLKEKQFPEAEELQYPISAYFEKDDYPLTAVISRTGRLLIYDRFKDEYYTSENKITNSDISLPAAGDIDGDGIDEVVITARDKIYGFNANASYADYTPFPYYPRTAELSSCVLGDINDDSKVDIIVATSEGNIEAWDHYGKMVTGFPLTTGASMPNPPTLLDIDKDDDLEIAAVSEKGVLFVWDLNSSFSATSIAWGSYLNDAANSGMRRKKPAAVPDKSDIMPSHLVYNYPNPAKGDFTYIRYRLEKQAEVSIEIYDLAGELVDSFFGPGMGNTENEIRWDISGVESGVYFCRVKADTGLKEKAVICKIAVIK